MTEQTVELKEQWTEWNDGLFEFFNKKAPECGHPAKQIDTLLEDDRKQHIEMIHNVDIAPENVALVNITNPEVKIEEMKVLQKEYYNSGDEVEFILNNEVHKGIIKGFYWKPGIKNDPDPANRPTPQSDPADTLAISVEGEKGLIKIANTDVIKQISCALNPLIVNSPSENNDEGDHIDDEVEEEY